MKRVLKIALQILAILLFVILCQLPGGIWVDSWEINKIALPLHYLVASIVYFVLFFFGFKYIRNHFFKDIEIYGLNEVKIHRSYLLYGTAELVLFYAGAMMIEGHFVFPEMDPYLFAQNAASFLGTFLVAPIIEELVFRGLIQGVISKNYNRYAGGIVSSLIFGAVHLMNGSLSLISAFQLIISGTLAGIMFSCIYLSTGSIWASVSVHALYNGIGTLVPVDIASTNDWPVVFVLNSKSQLLTGGDYGFDCALTTVIGFIIITVFILHRNESRKLCR
ncbi:MAG: CPBP family intramembrane metalloprotease [Lachnospiraceae bacterium]|nr:CPBP family intramembrane metalloprotease [Lachnospiraceae bacterium]